MATDPVRCPKCGDPLGSTPCAGEPALCSHCGSTVPLCDAPDAAKLVDPLIGQRLGQYEIIGLLGRGSMGAVYKARQASLDRLVAIKILPWCYACDAGFVERFQREARAAAAVNHPSIIQVHDVAHDRGLQYIAMEFVDGETLLAVLTREGRVRSDRALGILREVADALAEAHAVGVVHRDIKPSNILLTAKGHVKVADFGLAKRQGVDPSLTVSGASVGTPLYMPPEVSRGQPADARSDLYSLGATFYHVIAGEPPFEAAIPAAIIVKHIEAEAPPLAQAAPDAPLALCRIIHRLLEKDPAKRFASARELSDALAAVSAEAAPGQGDAARPSSAGPARPRHGRVALLVATVGVVAFALFALLGPRWRDRAEPGRSPHADRDGWASLFDGKSLEGWRVAKGGFFENEGQVGKVSAAEGYIVLDADGRLAVGVAYKGEVPLRDYEVTFEALRAKGGGNAGAVAFPMSTQNCAWSIGNAKKSCGLEMIDDNGDIDPGNPTFCEFDFVNQQWYRFRLRVEENRVRGWIDDRLVVDFVPQGHKLRLWEGYEDLHPLGFYAARDTEAWVRNIRIRKLSP